MQREYLDGVWTVAGELDVLPEGVVLAAIRELTIMGYDDRVLLLRVNRNRIVVGVCNRVRSVPTLMTSAD
ncbi:MAG: hypothetical protein M3N24_08200 [Actinomycetota bacterium]|nr:hypothetical protein [Actinomycetota bacterium]